MWLLAVMLSLPADKPGFSGEDLRHLCASEDTFASTICTSYLSGYVEGHEVTVQVSKAQRVFCLPAGGVTGANLGLVVDKWLDEHPQRLHEAALGLVTLALIDAYPCKR